MLPEFLLGDRIQATATDVLEALIEATCSRRRDAGVSSEKGPPCLTPPSHVSFHRRAGFPVSWRITASASFTAWTRMNFSTPTRAGGHRETPVLFLARLRPEYSLEKERLRLGVGTPNQCVLAREILDNRDY